MSHKLAVIGFGYVGLLLAHAFLEKCEMIGLIDIKGIVENPTWRL